MTAQEKSLQRRGDLVDEKDPNVVRAFLALLGPIGVYVLYFSVVYLLGEAGCKIDTLGGTLTGPAWLVPTSVVLGIISIGVIVWMALLARRLSSYEEDAYHFAGKAGLLMSGLALITTVATLIATVVLQPC